MEVGRIWHTYTQKHTHKVKRTQGQAAHSHGSRKNSGAQQWLCTRSAYTIFHHYCGEKTLNYWSAPLLPFLSASLPHPLSNSVFYSCFYFSRFTSLSLAEICKHNKTFLKWIPVVNKIINMSALLWNYLHKHQNSLSHAYTNKHIHRRWTQYCEHLRNLVQSSPVALQ